MAQKKTVSNPTERWARTKYGLTHAQASGVTEAMMTQTERWREQHGAAATSPLVRGYLLGLVRGESQ